MFGVGRSSIRAAVQSLVGLGLLERRAGVGTFVRSLSLEDLQNLVRRPVSLGYSEAMQLHEIRTMIETTAARLAARRRTERDLREMSACLERYRSAFFADDPEQTIDADLGFHRAIVAAAHNPVLLSLLESISISLRAHRRQYGKLVNAEELELVTTEHLAIQAAIRQQETAEAERLVARHMRHIWQQIEALSLTGSEANDLRPELFLLVEE